MNAPQKSYKIYNFTSTMSLHYLIKTNKAHKMVYLSGHHKAKTGGVWIL